MPMSRPISAHEIGELGLSIDWGSDFFTSASQFYIGDKSFNFRRAPFSVVQPMTVDPDIRQEFLNMACAEGRISWDCFSNYFIPRKCNCFRCEEYCFSQFCIIVAVESRTIRYPLYDESHNQPIIPDYRCGNWQNHHDFRSAGHIMGERQPCSFEPKKILFVAEWRAIYYLYNSNCESKIHQTSPPPIPTEQHSSEMKTEQLSRKWAMSKVIYWPSEGLNHTRLLRCIREALNVRGKQDTELLCRAAALLGIEIDSRVAQK